MKVIKQLLVLGLLVVGYSSARADLVPILDNPAIDSNFNYLKLNKLDLRPGDILPRKDLFYDLGSTTYRWANLYVSSITFTDGTILHSALGKVWQNVKDPPCNAVGDGVTDDLAAFNRCIGQLTTGYTMLIPSGNYRLTNSPTGLVNLTSVTIMGTGADSVLLFTHPTSNPFGLAFSDCRYITLKDLTIDGSGIVWDQAARGAVTCAGTVFGCYDAVFDNIRIRNWQGTGFLINTSSHVSITNSCIYRCYEHAMYLAGSTLCTLVNNFIEESGYNSGTTHVGLKVDNFSASTIAGTIIHNPQSVAIQVQHDNIGTSIIGGAIVSSGAAVQLSMAGGGSLGAVNGMYFERNVAGTSVEISSGVGFRVVNCEFNMKGTASAAIDTNASFSSTSCVISANYIHDFAAATAITLRNQSILNSVNGNTFKNGVGGIAINFQINTSSNVAIGNTFNNVTTGLIDAGTANQSAYNP